MRSPRTSAISGEVHAGERVEAHRALLARPRAGYHRAAEHHRHVARAIVGTNRLWVQVELRVGEGLAMGCCGPVSTDGLRAALQSGGTARRPLGHRVGAVQHHEPVGRRRRRPRSRRGCASSRPGACSCCFDVHGLHHVEVAHIRDLRARSAPAPRRSAPAPSRVRPRPMRWLPPVATSSIFFIPSLSSIRPLSPQCSTQNARLALHCPHLTV